MKDFKLVIQPKFSSELEVKGLKAILGLKRKFINLKIFCVVHNDGERLVRLLDQWRIDVIKVVETHKHSLKTLEFLCNDPVLLLDLMDVLNKSDTRLKEVAMRDCTLDHSIKSFPPSCLKPFKNLKKFTFARKFCYKVMNLADVNCLVAILATQTHLKELEIEERTESLSMLFENEIMTNCTALKLTKLSLSGSKAEFSTKGHENLIKFLKQRAGSLQELKFKCNFTLPLLECITKNLKLKKLEVDGERIPTDENAFAYVQKSGTLESLTIANKLKEEKCALGLMRCFPCLKYFAAELTVGSIMNKIGQSHKQLETLRVHRLPFSYLPNTMKFAALKTFDVEKTIDCEAQNWKSFLAENPTIETVSIRQFSVDTDRLSKLQSIMSSNVKHIKFRGRVEYIKEFVNFARQDQFKPLNTIELQATNVREETLASFFFNLEANPNVDWSLCLDELNRFPKTIL